MSSITFKEWKRSKGRKLQEQRDKERQLILAQPSSENTSSEEPLPNTTAATVADSPLVLGESDLQNILREESGEAIDETTNTEGNPKDPLWWLPVRKLSEAEIAEKEERRTALNRKHSPKNAIDDLAPTNNAGKQVTSSETPTMDRGPDEDICDNSDWSASSSILPKPTPTAVLGTLVCAAIGAAIHVSLKRS
jgi:hypothetical protein